MDVLKKKIDCWLNKPKVNDKSLFAKFYYADKNLTSVANELDSFDGRAEPERCSRLVGKLRQGQDQVLVIINQIMDELLGDARACRAYRAKFPEEVLQESLAGQLWFGAECLAAGSSIMNREAESLTMRPLAKAVSKSLESIRNQLREQCLRNNSSSASKINLDANDSASEVLLESLKVFDRIFAEFELLYVSAMVQVKSKEELEMQELLCVLFSETLQRALSLGLLKQDQVDSYDPALMFSIPRLAIVTGLIFYDDGPLNLQRSVGEMSDMFKPFRKLLFKLRELLLRLTSAELHQLQFLLCTNERSEMNGNITLSEKIEKSFEYRLNKNLNLNYCNDTNSGSEVHITQNIVVSNMNLENLSFHTSSITNDISTEHFESGYSTGYASVDQSPENGSLYCLQNDSFYENRDANQKSFNETLIHRLFVCIAGVADQLQTNFAADLRQILRIVFTINTEPTNDVEKKPNGENEFSGELRTTYNIQDLTVSSRSEEHSESIVHEEHFLNFHEPVTSQPHFLQRHSSTPENDGNSSDLLVLQPPRWIPDNDAPLCMNCAVPFGLFFRRRHHCRNCGGVFCNVCSSLCTPLPKYGLFKAVRVCKDCFLSETRN
uniref:CSON007170 protein n=1 Tax=Culicoides sonorensis TaxID=179676 RepID=A0A336LN55_CULSO